MVVRRSCRAQHLGARSAANNRLSKILTTHRMSSIAPSRHTSGVLVWSQHLRYRASRPRYGNCPKPFYTICCLCVQALSSLLIVSHRRPCRSAVVATCEKSLAVSAAMRCRTYPGFYRCINAALFTGRFRHLKHKSTCLTPLPHAGSAARSLSRLPPRSQQRTRAKARTRLSPTSPARARLGPSLRLTCWQK